MKNKLEVIEGNRGALEEQLLHAIFFDREKMPELKSKLLKKSDHQLKLVTPQSSDSVTRSK